MKKYNKYAHYKKKKISKFERLSIPSFKTLDKAIRDKLLLFKTGKVGEILSYDSNIKPIWVNWS